MPAAVHKQLLPTTGAGASRITKTIRKVMGNLVKMKLVSVADGQTFSSTGDTLHLVYTVNRYAYLDSFKGSLDADQPKPLASFDFAEPGAVDLYWERLRVLAKEWCDRYDKSDEQPAGAEDDGSVSGMEEDERPEPTVPTPKNASLPELFQRKNWNSHPWLAPHQRAALNEFFTDICLNHARKNEKTAECSLVAQDTRMVTLKSPEVAALSGRIMVPPDRVIKYCRQLQEVAGPHPSGAKVDFSSLSAVRFRCHICGHVAFMKPAVRDHYLRCHKQALPDDKSLYCEPDFYAKRLKTAKARKIPRVKRLKSKANKIELDMGDLEEVKEEPRDEMEDSAWLQLLVTAESMLPLQQRALGLPVSQCPVGPTASSIAAAWPMLARLTNFSEEYCRNRIRSILADAKKQRLVSTFRSEQVQAYKTQSCGDACRSVARCLLLSPFEISMIWWKPDFLTAEVRRLTDCVLKQWQRAGLVTRYNTRSKKTRRLPRGVRPDWTLTLYSRSRMFGKSRDFTRWQEVLVGLTSPHANPWQSVRTFFPETSRGTHILVLSEMVASDQGTLRAVWKDPDFYREAVAKTPAWQMRHELEEEDEDEEEEDGIFIKLKLGDFLKLGVIFWGPHDKDYGILGLHWGGPLMLGN